MSISALTTAAPSIQIHAYAALGAIAVTIAIFTRPRGTRTHRILGWAWVVLMGVTAASSFAVTELRNGQFSPIHLLSSFTLFMLFLGVKAARTHQVQRHRRVMLGLVFGALCVAGAFTLLPGRIMYAVLFGQ